MAEKAGIRRVAVTGASGFIGRRLVAALAGRHIPLPLLWQHLPGAAHFADRPLEPEEVLIWRVRRSLATYHDACRS